MKNLLRFSALLTCLGTLTAPAALQESLSASAYPLWTDTHLTLHAGDSVSINAAGTWQFGLGATSALGASWWTDTSDRFLSSAYQGELIAYVGSDPFQGHWGDGSFFPQSTGYRAIGTSSQFTSDKAGELWLGINDDAVFLNTGDNSGALSVQVSVLSVPEPGSGLLLLLGSLVALCKRGLKL